MVSAYQTDLCNFFADQNVRFSSASGSHLLKNIGFSLFITNSNLFTCQLLWLRIRQGMKCIPSMQPVSVRIIGHLIGTVIRFLWSHAGSYYGCLTFSCKYPLGFNPYTGISVMCNPKKTFKQIHFYNPSFCERHQCGYETVVPSLFYRLRFSTFCYYYCYKTDTLQNTWR